MKRIKLKQEKAITLLALVVTIIILLIISGVAISVFVGDNGLVTRAGTAKKQTVISMEKEQIALAYLSCSIDNQKKQAVTAQQLEAELEKDTSDITVTDNSDYVSVKFNNTDHTYLVDKNGNIKLSTDIVTQEYEEKKAEIDNGLVDQENIIDYADSIKTIVNPDRGLYTASYISISDSTDKFLVDMDSLCSNAIRSSQKIVHLRLNIGQLSGNVNSAGTDREFSDGLLDSLNSMFSKVRYYNLNAIVRFAYDFNGETNKEPKSFNTIEKHIEQLAEIFETNKDVITCVEAGFIGPWGEMHDGGDYQQDSYYKKMIEDLLDSTPESMTVNVRTPYYYKLIFGSLNNSSKNKYRLGIFNDGYLGSETDLGTFDTNTTRADFIDWMKVQGKYTYYGGETTKFDTSSSFYNSEDEQWSEGEYAISEMPKTHTTYLNSAFNDLILTGKWKAQTYSDSSSEYNNQTAYKYIVDHLGYRLVLRNSKISETVKQGEVCGTKLKIENVGFGNIIRKQELSVILSNGTKYYKAELNIDATKWESGESSDVNFYFNIPSSINAGEWNVYLKIASSDNSDYAIKFANEDVWNSNLDANFIGKVTIIENSDADETNIKQAFENGSNDGIEGIVIEKPEIELAPVKVSVTCSYYISATSTLVETKTVYLPLGTTIDFADESSLEALNLSIPSGYKFKFAQCPEITGDWGGYNSITIPSETSATSYTIQVHLDMDGIVGVRLDYYLQSDSSLVKTETVYLPLGTTIDFTNASSLTSLGISIPSNYEFLFAQAPDITGDWGGYNSITIPSETSATLYVFQVHIQ